MSDIITKIGEYQQHSERPERKARVVHIENGKAFGFDCDGEPDVWDCDTGVCLESYNITGPWQDPPAFSVGDTVLVNCPSSNLHQHYGTLERLSTINQWLVRFPESVVWFTASQLTRVTLHAPLPDGFRLKPRNVKADVGDTGIHSKTKEWQLLQPYGGWNGRTAETQDAMWPDYAPYFFAEPIRAPAPTRPEPGDGWRLLAADELTANGDERMDGCDCPPRWMAVNFFGMRVADYIEMYPVLKILGVRRRIVPEPEKWTPTCELEWRLCAVEDPLAVLQWDGDWRRLEQRFTCGDREQWRAIGVTQ